MHFELDIKTLDIDFSHEIFEQVKIPIQAAMAGRFAEICRENIGSAFGAHRASDWTDLTDKYAKRVGRTEATLFLTPAEAAKIGGESGKLFNSIQVDPYPQEAAVVFSDCEYAAVQQKTRPFFPMTPDGEITPYAKDEVTRAAQNELDRILK
jgi:hypothetical protein